LSLALFSEHYVHRSLSFALEFASALETSLRGEREKKLSSDALNNLHSKGERAVVENCIEKKEKCAAKEPDQ
jgi:hypothetical protein